MGFLGLWPRSPKTPASPQRIEGCGNRVLHAGTCSSHDAGPQPVTGAAGQRPSLHAGIHGALRGFVIQRGALHAGTQSPTKSSLSA